ncbi:MAG: hypothetical protein K2Y08_04440 [Alphaproteobacteria bacterium]|nr:hypothetical protein [Alphaproteobacteria bacterium]
MKFIKFFAVTCIIISGLIPSSFGCHRDDCPHSTTDTGIHWNRSLRFSFRDKEFNLLKNHQTMSRRAEEKEIQEGIDYLNIALGNIQFVYEDGGLLKTSPPFEIRALDEEGNKNPFFSNLGVEQATSNPFIKSLKVMLDNRKYKTAEDLLHSLKEIPLEEYNNKKNELIVKREELISRIKELTNLRKRQRDEKLQQSLYDNFMKKIKRNRVKSAKKLLKKITNAFPLEEEILQNIHIYFQEYKELKSKIRESIKKYVNNLRNNVMANRLLGEAIWSNKSEELRKQHSPESYIKLLQSLSVDFEQKLKEEEAVLNTNHVNFAWRRLQAPPRDFAEDTHLPFNRDQMLMDLNTMEVSHFQHSEQLLMYHLKTNFNEIAEELKQFLIRKCIGHTKIQGAFFNLFSTRDMCERCAVCLTIDHAHTNGIAAKLTKFIQNHNEEPGFDPFIVYSVSSRIPYSTPMGTERINSRELTKSVDSYSNHENGRDVTSLSKAHISIQSHFYSHTEGKEYTEDEINKINESYQGTIE